MKNKNKQDKNETVVLNTFNILDAVMEEFHFTPSLKKKRKKKGLLS